MVCVLVSMVVCVGGVCVCVYVSVCVSVSMYVFMSVRVFECENYPCNALTYSHYPTNTLTRANTHVHTHKHTHRLLENNFRIQQAHTEEVLDNIFPSHINELVEVKLKCSLVYHEVLYSFLWCSAM
jgi:hypothetical protein